MVTSMWMTVFFVLLPTIYSFPITTEISQELYPEVKNGHSFLECMRKCSTLPWSNIFSGYSSCSTNIFSGMDTVSDRCVVCSLACKADYETELGTRQRTLQKRLHSKAGRRAQEISPEVKDGNILEETMHAAKAKAPLFLPNILRTNVLVEQSVFGQVEDRTQKEEVK